MKKSLTISLPVLLTAACSSGTVDDLIEAPSQNQSCINYPKEEALQPYYELLTENDKLVKATGFCDFSQELQEVVWDKISKAEKTGLPPTAPIPASFYELYGPEQKKTKIVATVEEAQEIYAAHLAHSLWLEKNEILPWSIMKYSQEQLEELLQPKAWFETWDDAKNEYDFHLILDHSPRETYAVVQEMAPSLSDQRTALNDIVKAGRSYKHGSVTHDKLEIVTMKTMAENKKSFYGCQTMVPYIVQLANVLNIPGRTVWDYYADSDEGHRSAFFELTDQVLAHGDDPYDSWLGNTPSSELMDSYEFWKTNILSYPKGKDQSEHDSMIHNYRNTLKYPSNRIFKEYCDVITGDFGSGRDFLDQVFLNYQKGAFASLEEVNYFENKILNITKDCAFFPEDDPDN